MIKVCDKATEMQFSVMPPLYLPFYNRWGANAYYRYDAFSLDPFDIAASSTSGSPVLLTPQGFFGFLNETGGRFAYDGKGTLTIQSEGNNATWNFTDIDGYVEVDSEQMNFYKDAEPKNDTVSGDGFPLLYPGENVISYSGAITAVSVIPRWCCV